MSKLVGNLQLYLAGLLFAAILCTGPDTHAAVIVYAEGAYTATDLVVHIYADITGDPLVSNGVKIKFDKSKLNVSAEGAKKNKSVWFIGDGSATFPYINPEINNTIGEIIIIGGKLDTTHPTAGVIGNRILLGAVKFNRNESGVVPKNGATYFGISLEKGKGGAYVNFATTSGLSIDSSVDYITKGVMIYARGDASLDGIFTSADILKIKQIINNGPADSVIADCNADGIITSADILCVKKKM